MTLVKEARWIIRVLSDVQNEVLHKEVRALAQELWGVPALKFATREGALDFAKQVLTRVGGCNLPFEVTPTAPNKVKVTALHWHLHLEEEVVFTVH